MTTTTSARFRRVSEEPEWAVWLTVLVGLLAGWLVMTAATGRTATAEAGTSRVIYPAGWVRDAGEEGAIFAVTDVDGGVYGARASVRQLPKSELAPSAGVAAEEDAAGWALIRGQELEGYRVLGITPAQVGGKAALSVEYAYLTDPPLGASGSMPGLMHAIDTIVASGEEYYILTVAVEASESARLAELQQQLVAGWQVP
ncbi:MAG: hypothetical protein RLZZ387_1420 [Chloroflexota bacterium]